MKILILANNDVGLYKFRKELIRELLKKHEVVIALPNGGLIPDLQEMGCEYVDVEMERRGMNPVKDAALFFRFMSAVKKTKPDLVITYTVKPNIYGGLAAKIKKVPYVANITGLGTAFQNDGLLKNLVTTLYKTSLKKARTVFFENSDNRRLFVENKIVREEVTRVLPGAGVNLEEYSFAEYPADDKTTRFLFMARVMREKGTDELFGAMSRLVGEGYDCSLDVLGDYEEDYKALIEQYEKEGWLHYRGFQKDVKPFIANCHCFVLPSWHEGMANTNLENAASGRPVITSNIPGCMEAVEDNKSGFLCTPRDGESLYNAMKRFLELSYEERKQMGQNGRKRMEERFDKKTVVKTTIEGMGIADE